VKNSALSGLAVNYSLIADLPQTLLQIALTALRGADMVRRDLPGILS
jgi:hypothetical protein